MKTLYHRQRADHFKALIKEAWTRGDMTKWVSDACEQALHKGNIVKVMRERYTKVGARARGEGTLQLTRAATRVFSRGSPRLPLEI